MFSGLYFDKIEGPTLVLLAFNTQFADMSIPKKLSSIHAQIRACRECPSMCSTPVHGPAIETPIILVGQAPGAHESSRGRPFAYTAGKTLFGWFQEFLGVDEETFREKVYIASVARCFPGKNSKGKGDREPSIEEIQNCRRHLSQEVQILKPKLVLAVGKVAIQEVLGPVAFPKGATLAQVVGKSLIADFHGLKVEVLALPHPSGISTWPHIEPGKSLMKKAFRLIQKHPDWKESFEFD